MRTIFILLFFFQGSVNSASAQNLIPNPSFEDINICTEHSAPCAPSGWITPSPFLPEYRGQPGEKHISLICFNSSKPNVRQYVQTQLMCPLEKGKTYILSLSLKQEQCLIGSIGVLFSDSLIYADKDILIPIQPSVELADIISSYSKRKQKEWVQIETNYVATGKEKYMIIGNFQREKDQQRDYIEKEKRFTNYRYSLDNVSLQDSKTDSLCEKSEEIKTHWYSYHIRHSQVKIKEFIYSKEPAVLLDSIPPRPRIDSIQLSSVIFKFNSSTLEEDAKIYINKILANLNTESIAQISIEGHTDNVGDSTYNMTLSLARALSVKEQLIENGIHEDKIVIAGKGDTMPILDNNLEEGRKKNRRIELTVTYQ